MISFTISRADQRLSTRWRWKSVATRWVLETSAIAHQALKDKAPVGKTGRLRDSIDYTYKVDSRTASIEFATRVPYARYVLEGTPAHLIVPRKARVLAWQQGGQWVYRQRVNHPGARANNFPEKAIRPLVPVISGRMRNLVVDSMGAV